MKILKIETISMNSSRRFSRDFTVIALLGILAAFLRLLFIGKQSLWTDEAFSVWVAGHPLQTILQILKVDAHPPLFYSLLHGWMSFGRSEAFLRFPSALFGVLNCMLVYLLGKSLFNARLGLIASLFWACSFAALNQETQVRMYAFATTLSLAASLVFWFAWKRQSPASWLFYGVLGAICLYIHYFTFFILSAHVVFLLLRRQWKPALFCLVFFGVTFSFCLPLFLTQMRAGGGSLIPLTPPIEYAMNLAWLLLAYRFFDLPIYYILGTLLASALVFLAVWQSRKEKQDEIFFLMLLFLIPYAVPFLLSSTLSLHLLAFRYLILLAPYYYLLVFIGLSKLPRVVHLPLTGALLLVNLIVWFFLLTSPSFERQNWKAAAAILRRNVRANDAVLVEEAPAIFPLCYYLPDLVRVDWREKTYLVIPQNPQIPWLIAEGERNLSQVAELSNRSKRQWLIWFEGYYPDPRGVVKNLLLKNDGSPTLYRLRSFDIDNEIYIYLFSPRSSESHTKKELSYRRGKFWHG